MNYHPDVQLWEGESNKIIKLCYHCGDEILKTKALCDFCTTKDKREELHETNKKIFEIAGLVFECKPCKKLFEKKEQEKLLGLKIVSES